MIRDVTLIGSTTFVFIGTVLRMWDSMAEADKDAEFLPRTSTQRCRIFKFTMLDRVEDAVTRTGIVLPEDSPGLVLPGGGFLRGPGSRHRPCGLLLSAIARSKPEIRVCGVGLDTWCVVEVDPERFEVMVSEALDGIPEALGELMSNVAVTVQHDGGPGACWGCTRECP